MVPVKTRPRDTLVRAPRFAPPRKLVVESKTIGTSLAYQFTTDNLSLSGLLLSSEQSARVPFNVNTIVEMTIDPDGEWLQQPVACLGKVVRRETKSIEGASRNAQLTCFGIQIVQIDNQDMNNWEKCVSELEQAQVRKTFAPPPPPPPTPSAA